MRAQIGGLKQASRNAQSGITLLQAAADALGETHAIVQRMPTVRGAQANMSARTVLQYWEGKVPVYDVESTLSIVKPACR